MKNLLFGMLAMAAMVSCSSENDPIDDVTGGKQDKVEIKLNAGVVGVETKAAVTAWDNTKVNFAKKGSTTFDEDWYATIGSDKKISFTESNFTTPQAHYYNNDGSNTTLVGYYPTENITRTANEVSFEIPANADMDIMSTASQNGNKKVGEQFGEFTFNHLLTQLTFEVLSDAGYTGGSITSIILKGTNRKAKLDLTNPSALTFESLAAGNDITVYNGTITPNGTAQSAGEAVMVQAGADMTLTIVAGSTTYENISIVTTETDNKTKAGTSYKITLTFSGKTVSAEAGLTAWDTTGTGSGRIE